MLDQQLAFPDKRGSEGFKIWDGDDPSGGIPRHCEAFRLKLQQFQGNRLKREKENFPFGSRSIAIRGVNSTFHFVDSRFLGMCRSGINATPDLVPINYVRFDLARFTLNQRKEMIFHMTEPSTCDVVIYSIVIPIICTFGMVGNFLILAVLSKRSLKASTYTYLAVLAGADLVNCALMTVSGVLFWCRTGWPEFDAFVHLPVGSVSSNIAVWATVGVSLDRLVVVCCTRSRKRPKFCEARIAGRVMIVCSCFVIVINIPYCFLYRYNENGHLVTTTYFRSSWYHVQNWFQLVAFGLVPSLFLLISNGILCYAVRNALKQRHLLLQRKRIGEGNRLRDQIRLTITLVGIVFVFTVGELPMHLASRLSAVSILYAGDVSKMEGRFFASFGRIATILNAVSVSTNFVLYCLLSPNFLLHLKHLLNVKHKVVEDDVREYRNRCRMKITTVQQQMQQDPQTPELQCKKLLF